MTDARIDLHSHTTASDGLLAPADLVAEASRRGLRVLGITDHDTLDGLTEATAATDEAGIELVPGVELSTTVPVGEIHMLGYYVNQDDGAFVGELRRLADARISRVRAMLEKLRALGHPVDADRVLAQADSGSIGRPHVARELMRIGAIRTVGEGFDRFLKAGRPAYVPRESFSPEDAVALLLGNGAIPVLAHPFSSGDPAGTVARLVPAGLRGIEVYYAEYTTRQHAELAALADRFGLLKTGGSDYHGNPEQAGRELGAAPVPDEVIGRLREARAR